MQNDGAERGCPNPVQDEIAELQREVASSKDQCDSSNDKIAVVTEVHFVDHPDASARYGDQSKDHYGHPAKNRPRDGLNQCTEFRGEPQQDCDQRSNDKHQGGIDACHSLDAGVFSICCYTRSSYCS